MSVCTLPYLPLLLLGIYRSRQPGQRAGAALIAVATAALWLCHPPIAFWATIIAASSGTVSNATATATLNAVGSTTLYITGFDVSYTGSTAAGVT